jgi:hypothetical protein
MEHFLKKITAGPDTGITFLIFCLAIDTKTSFG